MVANTQYNDFKGTVSADIPDAFGSSCGDDIKSIARIFKLNLNRFKPVGISLYGTDGFSISLLCVDKERSTEEKEHIVNMSCEVETEKKIIDLLFKRLHIVLHNSFDDKYPNLDYDEKVSYSDFH
jgi:hypothetical protein